MEQQVKGLAIAIAMEQATTEDWVLSLAQELPHTIALAKTNQTKKTRIVSDDQ